MDDQIDLDLACLSHMSIAIIFVPNIKIHPVMFNFIINLFRLDEEVIDKQNYKHAILAFHGPKISEKIHLIQVLSSGYVNFIQVFDMVHGSILGSE